MTPIELFIHAETTGIYKSTMALTDAAQPWICRFSMIAREQNRVINTANLLVRCEHPIPSGAYGVHGISQEDTHKYGVPPKAAHALLAKHLAMGPVIYGYNVEFVLGCLKVQAARLGDPIDLGTNTGICVMQEAYDWMYSGESDQGQMKFPQFKEAWISIMHASSGMNTDRSLRVFDIARMHDYVQKQNLTGKNPYEHPLGDYDITSEDPRRPLANKTMGRDGRDELDGQMHAGGPDRLADGK